MVHLYFTFKGFIFTNNFYNRLSQGFSKDINKKSKVLKYNSAIKRIVIIDKRFSKPLRIIEELEDLIISLDKIELSLKIEKKKYST